MIDKELLDNLKQYYKARKSAFENGEAIRDQDNKIIAYKYLKQDPICNNAYSWDIINVNQVYESIINSRVQKSSRIQKHIVYGLTHYKYAWFGTFTFNDDFISKSDRTQRDAIKNALKRLKIDYILNVDFGDLNERKHFHCILFLNQDLKEYTTFKIVSSKGATKGLQVDLKGYTAGFSSFEPIGSSKADILSLKKYINKLSNHCQKDSTENKRIVYSFKAYEKDYYKLHGGFTIPNPTNKDKRAIQHYNNAYNRVDYLNDRESLGFEIM